MYGRLSGILCDQNIVVWPRVHRPPSILRFRARKVVLTTPANRDWCQAPRFRSSAPPPAPGYHIPNTRLRRFSGQNGAVGWKKLWFMAVVLKDLNGLRCFGYISSPIATVRQFRFDMIGVAQPQLSTARTRSRLGSCQTVLPRPEVGAFHLRSSRCPKNTIGKAPRRQHIPAAKVSSSRVPKALFYKNV